MPSLLGSPFLILRPSSNSRLIAYGTSLGLKKLLPTAISPAVVGIAITVSFITGIVAGFMPAWRAARMNPVDALRAE